MPSAGSAQSNISLPPSLSVIRFEPKTVKRIWIRPPTTKRGYFFNLECVTYTVVGATVMEHDGGAAAAMEWASDVRRCRGSVVPFKLWVQEFNILRYEVGQRYNSHYDVFNPAEYGPQKSQRMASFLLYLTDVPEGGETMFPYENGSNMDGSYGYEDCIGLRVRPRKGDGLLFYSLFPNGTIDPTSLHGSCPVIKGEKWVATKWIRDQDWASVSPL